MVFRSQFLYPFLLATSTVALLACLNWQCLLLVFLVGGIGWGLWAVSSGNSDIDDKRETREHRRNKAVAVAMGRTNLNCTGKEQIREPKPDNAVLSDKSRVYRFPKRSHLATK